MTTAQDAYDRVVVDEEEATAIEVKRVMKSVYQLTGAPNSPYPQRTLQMGAVGMVLIFRQHRGQHEPFTPLRL